MLDANTNNDEHIAWTQIERFLSNFVLLSKLQVSKTTPKCNANRYLIAMVAGCHANNSDVALDINMITRSLIDRTSELSDSCW